MLFAFFDLDDTLVDTRAALRAWSVEFAAEYVPADRVPGGGDPANDVFEYVDAAESWTQFVAEARARYGITASDEALMAHVAAVYPGKFVLEDPVRRGLEDLRAAGWRLGVVTNGTTLVQQAKVDSVALRPHVDVVVDSQAAGHRKPDPRIFQVAAAELGVELGPHGWMVGDRLDKDVAGGAAAGLRTIWIAQDGQNAQEGQGPRAGQDGPSQDAAEGARPTRIAASITEAMEIVGKSR